MDINLQGFEVTSPDNLFIKMQPADRWQVKQTYLGPPGLGLARIAFEVTLFSLGDGSVGPLYAWTTGAETKQVTFHMGKPVTLIRNEEYLYIHYIRDSSRRIQYNRFNYISIKCPMFDRSCPHPFSYTSIANGFFPKIIRPDGSYLKIILTKEGIKVKHQRNTRRGQRIKIFTHNLKNNFEIEVNSETSFLLNNLIYFANGVWVWLEEREGRPPNTHKSSVSTKTVPIPRTYAPRNLAETVLHYIKNKRNFDLKLVAKDGTAFNIHRVLVEATTSILENEREENNEVRLQVSKGALEDLTHFLLHGEVKNMHSNVLELFELACKYQVAFLGQMCEEHLHKNGVSPQNECEVERLALEYKSDKLLDALMEYRVHEDKCVFSPTNSIFEDLASLSDEESDVTLLSRDKKEVKCFSLLLMSRSKIFKKTLQLELKWQPGSTKRISVPDFDADVLQQFAHFLKSDRVPDMEQYALQLLAIADQYQVKKLGVSCIEYIYDNVHDFDYFELMKAASKFRSSKLFECLKSLRE